MWAIVWLGTPYLFKLYLPVMMFFVFAVGRHDGILYEKRYFLCEQDYGIFVPLHEIVCVIACSVSYSSKNFVQNW